MSDRKSSTTPDDLESAFEPAHGGVFRERFGPAGANAAYSNKKVCLAATDKPFLVAFLYELSLRPDCYYVKYSVKPRDGMHLGRCFLTSDAAAGRLCNELKSHPKFLVSLQDDDFFNDFRGAQVSTPDDARATSKPRARVELGQPATKAAHAQRARRRPKPVH